MWCVARVTYLVGILIIIMAGMAVVFKRGWLPHRGEAQMA